MILFLDFDGVLHGFPAPQSQDKLFVDLPRLEIVLREYPHLLLVISSSWREDHDISFLKRLFSSDIAPRVVDVLPVIEVGSLEDLKVIRFREIQLYLAGQNIPWVALDDDDELFPAECEHLVVCKNGFDFQAESKLREKLNQHYSIPA